MYYCAVSHVMYVHDIGICYDCIYFYLFIWAEVDVKINIEKQQHCDIIVLLVCMYRDVIITGDLIKKTTGKCHDYVNS